MNAPHALQRRAPPRRPTALLALLGLLALLAATPPPVAADPLDSIVAVVNNDVIMRSELTRQVRQVSAQMEQQGARTPPADVLERQVLERLILVKLQVQQAESTGIRVDDETLNQAIGRIAQENGVSINEFRDILERDGFDFVAFREDIRQEIVMTRLRQREIDNLVTVSDREIENYLATQSSQGGAEAEYRVAHILVASPEAASPEELEATERKANDILRELQEGADFQQTAMARSDGQQALQGGDLGWRRASQLPTLFAERVGRMSDGELSELIPSPSGFHIIKLVATRSGGGGEAALVRQTHAQHILVRASEVVSGDDARTRLEQLKLRIDGGADFAELARSHSDDRATSVNGGDLGWVSPGDLVPEFEKVMDALGPGEVSTPFESQFGWHIVRVLERRSVDSTEEVRRAQAKDAIRARKIDEEREAWLRRLRDEAYVEYRVPGLDQTATGS